MLLCVLPDTVRFSYLPGPCNHQSRFLFFFKKLFDSLCYASIQHVTPPAFYSFPCYILSMPCSFLSRKYVCPFLQYFSDCFCPFFQYFFTYFCPFFQYFFAYFCLFFPKSEKKCTETAYCIALSVHRCLILDYNPLFFICHADPLDVHSQIADLQFLERLM